MKICKVASYDLSLGDKEAWKKMVHSLSERFRTNHKKALIPWKKSDYMKFKSQSPNFNYESFITPMWQRHYDHIEKLMLENKSDLLRDELVQYAMALSVGGTYQKKQLPYLQAQWDDADLKRLLVEDYCYSPYITDESYQTSETLINHLTHLTFFSENRKVDLSKLNCVVEFGGGYGSMARLLKRLNPNITHIIIDLPLFCFIQESYIKNSSIGGSANLLLSEKDKIDKGNVNIIPIGNTTCLDQIAAENPDLFIATWSLSEANKFTQDFILQRKYFLANHLLMGYRHYADKINPDQPESDSLKVTEQYALELKEEVFFGLNQHYLFASRVQ